MEDNLKGKTLNNLYNQYTNSKISKSKFEASIFRFYLLNQHKTPLSQWKRDEYEDFISWFYTRIQKATEKYTDTGFSFEAYMNKFLLISSKEYKIRKIRGSVTEYSTWSAQLPDLYVNEQMPEYLSDNYNSKEYELSEIISRKAGRKDNRRILALIIKCYSFISDDFIDKIAPKIEIHKSELKHMIDKIHIIRQKNDDEIYLLKEKISCQYYKNLVTEKKLSTAGKNTALHAKLKKQLETGIKKLAKLRDQYNNKRKDASNSQVAEVIGIQKGSVDSSLYKLKEKFVQLAADKEPVPK